MVGVWPGCQVIAVSNKITPIKLIVKKFGIKRSFKAFLTDCKTLVINSCAYVAPKHLFSR